MSFCLPGKILVNYLYPLAVVHFPVLAFLVINNFFANLPFTGAAILLPLYAANFLGDLNFFIPAGCTSVCISSIAALSGGTIITSSTK